ncbi:MAG: RluA family pseudouridine synthase [Spirochaetaceae bacterium]|nr:RluA family pseudouridine synthase [Spirochaetaceae bacterium]
MAKNIPIVYEDENFLVLNKPAGLLTIPAPGKSSAALTETLYAACLREGVSWKPHPCHRLDGETSGLILFAKGKSKQKSLMELFHLRQVRKTYIAFVQGDFKKNEGVFTRSLEGQPARTLYRVQEQREAGSALFAVVEVNPETGRKNQIRLHFKAAGHPLVGETRFAFRKDFPIAVRRLMLHAARLEFSDPWTGDARDFTAELPEDMQAFLDKSVVA